MLVLSWQVAVAALALGMALNDARRFEVPNSIPAGLAALFLLAAISIFPSERSLISAATGAAVFTVGFGLFIADLLPGGDAKALAAAALIVAPWDWVTVLIAFWLMTLFFGLVLLFQGRGKKSRFPMGLPIGLTLAGYALSTPP